MELFYCTKKGYKIWGAKNLIDYLLASPKFIRLYLNTLLSLKFDRGKNEPKSFDNHDKLEW